MLISSKVISIDYKKFIVILFEKLAIIFLIFDPQVLKYMLKSKI
ncbi:hypothetical protein RBEAN4_1191 [Rickettsia bellii str. RML An4]|uniref:Uncharacterized protein n=1 Tax=Rickettsia bellii str. RML An4 TaxID=1359193 RepID=A0A0F3QFJ1_RICBE|nr:hypothetical protein RBEAN4_1191 [Rickettsia bellii str. RML An4]